MTIMGLCITRRMLQRSSMIGISILCLAAPAAAQSMDHDALEALFGEPVTASATGLPQRRTEAPVDMVIVTAEDIRRSGAHDLVGVLSHVPGVDVLQWTSEAADVSIRGYDQSYAARTLVLVDGRQVYADYYGFVPWSTLPVELSAIRQIEIVKGPNAALFGFNAVGGVINIITYNPRYDAIDALTLRTGTLGMAEASLVTTLKLGSRGGVRLSGGYRSGQEFSQSAPSDMFDISRNGSYRSAVDIDGVFALTGNVELGIEASHSKTKQSEVSPGYAIQNSWYETNSVKGQLLADTDIGLVKLLAYGNWINWRGTPLPISGTFRLNSSVSVVQMEDAFNLGGDNSFRLAAEYRHNSANTSPVSGGEVSTNVFAGSVMWHWQVTDGITWTNAARFDHLELDRNGSVPVEYPYVNADWNRSIDVISFNSGLVWSPTPLDTVRLIGGRGVQLPSLVQSGAMLIETSIIHATGNPDLKTTMVQNGELSWNHKLADWNAELQLSLFAQKSSNMISISGNTILTPTGYYVTPSNVGSSQALGGEAIFNGVLGESWHWQVSYRAEFIDDDFVSTASTTANMINYQDTTPQHLVKAGLSWSDSDWDADVFLRYQSDSKGVRQGYSYEYVLADIGAFTAIDARLAWKLSDWATIAISGQNLLQKKQRQTSGPEVERRLFLSLSVKG